MEHSTVPYEVLQQTSPLTNEQQTFLQKLAFQYGWSNRSTIKIIRIARTLSDLQGNQQITDTTIWEAVKLHGRQTSIKNQKMLMKR